MLDSKASTDEMAMGGEDCEDAMEQMGAKSDTLARLRMVGRPAARSKCIWSTTHKKEARALSTMGVGIV